ncbi:MAG TPA: iron dicitrate transport regulator FecR [Actinomycetota bacterium]|nr:iron dicitrate transport regulator FecR [Actinomycetota bacterium]
MSWRPDPARFLADLETVPAGLRALADRLVDPWPVTERPDRVVLLGLGSSRYAALVGAAALRAAGIDAVAEHAGASAAFPGGAGTLAVGISASGTTPQTVAALGRHAGAGSRTVAVTAAPDASTALGEVAAGHVDLACGPEAGGIACRTFRHTVVRLLQLRTQLAGDDVAQVARAARLTAVATDDLLARRPTWLPAVVEHLEDGSSFLIAPAERLGSAAQAALTLREGPRRVATACESNDWPHVDVYLTKPLGPDYRAILGAGSDADAEIARWIEERGARLAVVGPGVDPVGGPAVRYRGDDDRTVRLLADALVAELAAAALWTGV